MKRSSDRYIFSSDILRRHDRRRKRIKVILLAFALLIISLVVANFLISRNVKVEEVRITILNLPKDLEEYSILHISDLHGARYGKKQKAIETALRDYNYSCVVMTGDMLGNDQDVEPLLELVALIPEGKPIIYIPGDMDPDPVEYKAHSSLSPYAGWAEQLQNAGVTILDRPVKDTRGKGTIWFIPEELYAVDLDEMEKAYNRQREALKSILNPTPDDNAYLNTLDKYQLGEEGRIAEIRRILAEIKPEDIQIVLTHIPLTEEYIDRMVSGTKKEDIFSLRYAGLILAGHYNGGQWRIPFVGALYEPDLGWFPPDDQIQGLSYPYGIPQYISPGMGSDPRYTWEPGRLFNSPVITKITLTRKAR